MSSSRISPSMSLDSDLWLYKNMSRARKAKPRPRMRTVCSACDKVVMCNDIGGAWTCEECAPQE